MVPGVGTRTRLAGLAGVLTMLSGCGGVPAAQTALDLPAGDASASVEAPAATSAKVVDVASLRSPVLPPACGHPPARASDGTARFDRSGKVWIAEHPQPVFADLTGDGVDDALAVLDCTAADGTHGGASLVLFHDGGRVLDTIDLSTVEPAQEVDVESLAVDHGQVELVFETRQGPDLATERVWQGTVAWYDGRLLFSDLRPASDDCAPGLPDALQTVSARSLLVRCTGDWAWADVGDQPQIWTRWSSDRWYYRADYGEDCAPDLRRAGAPDWLLRDQDGPCGAR